MNLQPAPTKPAAGNRHAERSEATRAQLIQAAIQVVRDKGYQGASVFEVAKAAGLTPGAFQHHFGTKAVLMMRVVDELVAASDYNAPGWPAADLPLAERARETLQLLWQRIYEPERFLVAWQVYMGCGADPEITRYIAGLRQTQQDQLRQRFLTVFPELSASPDTPALIDLAVEVLAPINADMRRLMEDPGHIDAVLRDGGERARARAEKTMNEVRDIIGFVR